MKPKNRGKPGKKPGRKPGEKIRLKKVHINCFFSFVKIHTSIGKSTLLLTKANNREKPGRKPGENPT